MNNSKFQSIHQDKKQNLSQARIVKQNLVYIIGLSQEIAKSEVNSLQILNKQEFLGQYGKINQIIINKPFLLGQNKNQYSVYVTFNQEKDAMICRLALSEFKYQNNIIKASYGTTKYCQYYISKQKCQNSECLYLHSKAQPQEIYSQDQVQQGIKALQKQQQDYFLKNIHRYNQEKEKYNSDEYQFPTFCQLIKKYQKNFNIDLDVCKYEKIAKNKINTVLIEDNEQDVFEKINMNQLNNIIFKCELDKKIIYQTIFKQLNNNQISRFDFALDMESTEDSIEQKSEIYTWLIDDQNINRNQKINFEVLTGSGKLNKSHNKINFQK